MAGHLMNSCLFLVTPLLILMSVICQDDYTVPNFFKLRFRPSSTMGLYVAVVVPIDLPGREAYLGWFFEAIHSLPSNETSYEYPPLVSRAIERKTVYNALESRIKSSGYPGKPCLLRVICETAMHSVEKTNGVLGDVLHIMLTPSSTKNINLDSEYLTAESMGRRGHNCRSYHKNCSISLIDLISWIDDIL